MGTQRREENSNQSPTAKSFHQNEIEIYEYMCIRSQSRPPFALHLPLFHISHQTHCHALNNKNGHKILIPFHFDMKHENGD